MLPEIQLFDLVRIRREGPEQIKADQNCCNDAPYPIYAEFRPFPLTIVVVSPWPESGKVVFIVGFQIFWWHFELMRVDFLILINKGL
jgi:hypothetical protein